MGADRDGVDARPGKLKGAWKFLNHVAIVSQNSLQLLLQMTDPSLA